MILSILKKIVITRSSNNKYETANSIKNDFRRTVQRCKYSIMNNFCHRVQRCKYSIVNNFHRTVQGYKYSTVSISIVRYCRQALRSILKHSNLATSVLAILNADHLPDFWSLLSILYLIHMMSVFFFHE